MKLSTLKLARKLLIFLFIAFCIIFSSVAATLNTIVACNDASQNTDASSELTTLNVYGLPAFGIIITLGITAEVWIKRQIKKHKDTFPP